MEEHDAEDEEQKETRNPSWWGDTFEERVEAFFPLHLNVNYKNLETVSHKIAVLRITKPLTNFWLNKHCIPSWSVRATKGAPKKLHLKTQLWRLSMRLWKKWCPFCQKRKTQNSSHSGSNWKNLSRCCLYGNGRFPSRDTIKLRYLICTSTGNRTLFFLKPSFNWKFCQGSCDKYNWFINWTSWPISQS